jgi:hypothetical protein
MLGKASVRLLGGSEVTLINFSERGILFQSETRLLVGARGTVRIVVGGETTIAAGTVVRSLVQGMASGKLAFHTALHLDQPLALATAIEARERAKPKPVPPPAPEPEPETEPEPEPEPEPQAAPPPPPPPAPSGKTIEKRSHKKSAPPEPEPPAAAPEPVAPPPVAEAPPAPASVPPAPAAPAAPVASSGFGDAGFGGGDTFGWSDPSADAAGAGLSVLFVSTTKDRTSRLQGMLADHTRDITLTTLVHSKAEALADVAAQHDVLLFDFAIGPEALEKTLSALRTSPLGASIAIFVPQQTALPPAVSSLANACVIDTASGSMLAAALRDAAWTPWQPVETAAGATAREDLFWKAFDALPVPVIVVDASGTIAHANGATTKLADGVEIVGKPLASFFVDADAPAIAKLVADGLAGGFEDTPVFTAPADGKTVQVMLQALSVLPGATGASELAIRCELRAEPVEAAPVVETGPDLAADVAALTAERDELKEIVAAASGELRMLREEIEQARAQIADAQAGRDALRGELEQAQRERDEQRAKADGLQRELDGVRRDLDRLREQESAGAAKMAELERLASDAARMEVAMARNQSQQAATLEELNTLRGELDTLRLRTTSQGADAERNQSRYAAIESSARQAVDELKAARTDLQRLTKERDQAVAAAEAEKVRANAAVAAAREDAKKPRKIGASDDAAALSVAKLQRQVDELRAELKGEQDARKELEELLDQNAENLEHTIQEYETKLEALGAGIEDKRAHKPKKSQRG